MCVLKQWSVLQSILVAGAVGFGISLTWIHPAQANGRPSAEARCLLRSAQQNLTPVPVISAPEANQLLHSARGLLPFSAEEAIANQSITEKELQAFYRVMRRLTSARLSRNNTSFAPDIFEFSPKQFNVPRGKFYFGWGFVLPFGKQLTLGGLHVEDVHGIYFQTPFPELQQRQFLVFLKALENRGLASLPEDMFGIAFRNKPPGSVESRTFWVIDGARLKNAKPWGPAYKKIPELTRNFVLERYRERLKLTPSVEKRLREISEQTEDRSLFLFVSKESFMSEQDILPEDANEDQWMPAGYRELHEPANPRIWNELTLYASLTVVLSKGIAEPLPLEMLTGFQVPRLRGRKKIAEIGRYVVTQDGLHELSPRMVQQVAAALAGRNDVGLIVIEADAARARLFKKYGFRAIREQTNYEGKTEYILVIEPDALLSRVLEADFPTETLDQWMK